MRGRGTESERGRMREREVEGEGGVQGGEKKISSDERIECRDTETGRFYCGKEKGWRKRKKESEKAK